MEPDKIKASCKQQMDKAIAYLKAELDGVRTGKASPGLVEHLKVEVASYGSTMDLRELAAISAPEPALLVIKPFDPGTGADIEKAIKSSNLGLSPAMDAGAIRLNVPPLSGERRQQLINEIKRMGEDQKIVVRNARRDANKHLDASKKEDHISEDEIDHTKQEVQKLTKKYEQDIDSQIASKQKELEAI